MFLSTLNVNIVGNDMAIIGVNALFLQNNQATDDRK